MELISLVVWNQEPFVERFQHSLTIPPPTLHWCMSSVQTRRMGPFLNCFVPLTCLSHPGLVSSWTDYVFISGRVSPAASLSFAVVLALLGLLNFHIHFQISLSQLHRKHFLRFWLGFNWTSRSVQGEVALHIVSLNHEQGVSLCSLRSSLVSFKEGWHFLHRHLSDL